MALINRISRLFKADFNAVLDRIEEPEQLLRQAIRDMQEELDSADQRIVACVRDQELLVGRRNNLTQKLADVEEELDLCFGSKKHDLARSLVRKKLEGQRLLARLDENFDTNKKQLDKATSQMAADRAALESLKQKAEIFSQHGTRTGATEREDPSWMAGELNVSDDEIEVAFLREQKQRSAS